jgi:hypothetical protein
MLFDNKSGAGQAGGDSGQPEKPQSHALRNSWIIFGIVMAVALIYTGLTFYSRWEDARNAQEQAQEKQRESDAETLKILGGDEFNILNFYASPGHLHPGDSASLCYGTANTKSVTLDPPVANVYPAYANCVHVSPKKTTTYTLTATDAQGHTKTESLTIEVK